MCHTYLCGYPHKLINRFFQFSTDMKEIMKIDMYTLFIGKTYLKSDETEENFRQSNHFSN